MRIGLTGGIGSGKSEVAKIFADHGAFIIDTDQLAREAVAPNSDGLFEIARIWPQVIGASGLDRAALAQVVFSDPAARERLNAIVHPHVRRLAAEREQYAKPGQLIVQVVPLLFETGYAEMMDKTVLVVAPENDRIARIVARDRVTEDQVRARMAAQIDPVLAQKRADFIVENDGDIARLRDRTSEIYEQLTN